MSGRTGYAGTCNKCIPLKSDYKRQINHPIGRTGYSFCPGIQMTEILIYAIWLMV